MSRQEQVGLTKLAEDAWELVRQLPADLKEVIELRFVYGLSRAEIADTLELPEGTVATRQRGALASLKEKLPISMAPAGLISTELSRTIEIGGKTSAPCPPPPQNVLNMEKHVMNRIRRAKLRTAVLTASVVAVTLLVVSLGASTVVAALYTQQPGHDRSPRLSGALEEAGPARDVSYSDLSDSGADDTPLQATEEELRPKRDKASNEKAEGERESVPNAGEDSWSTIRLYIDERAAGTGGHTIKLTQGGEDVEFDASSYLGYKNSEHHMSVRFQGEGKFKLTFTFRNGVTAEKEFEVESGGSVKVVLRSAPLVPDIEFETPERVKASDKYVGIELNGKERMYTSPTLYDINQDGHVDLIVGDLWGDLTYTLGSEDGWTEEKVLNGADGKPLSFANW